MQLHIENMTCGGCARSVTKAIQSVDPAAKIDVDQTARNVVVTTSTGAGDIVRALEAAGYPATAVSAN